MFLTKLSDPYWILCFEQEAINYSFNSLSVIDYPDIYVQM